MKRREVIILGIVSLLSVAGYLLASKLVYRLGFPLDDAWIHQTYARNLAIHGKWAFLLGESSGGSTGPLWGFLLAIPHLLRIGPYVGTYLLGFFSLWAVALLGAYLFGLLSPEQKSKRIWVGVLLALEWHLAWAAGSGMETLLFITLILACFVQLASPKTNWLALGVLIGLSVWVRPGGMTLLAPAGLSLWIKEHPSRQKFLHVSELMLGFALLFVPYLAFNQAVAGDWWPNTFYAKQAEYAILRQTPLWRRALNLGLLPLVGVGVLVFPGFVLFFLKLAREGKWSWLMGALWGLGYVGLYAWRLPVTYQHGRYLIPVVPVLIIWGMAGLLRWVRPGAEAFSKRLFSRVWVLSLVVVGAVFWARGASAYAHDVAIIESEMVYMAQWVAENTPSDALVAAHDIGALGYFGGRDILDLAGLVSPEVIPFIRDEDALADYLNAQDADYLLIVREWYPALEKQAHLEFQSAGEFSPRLGGQNMALYRWYPP